MLCVQPLVPKKVAARNLSSVQQSEINQYLSQKYLSLNVKRPIFLSDVKQNLDLLTHFNKSTHYKISSKSVQWEPSCWMLENRHDEANFANAPKQTGSNSRQAHVSESDLSLLSHVYQDIQLL